MKINKVYIGNGNEAYVSPDFNDGINLIYSNDNNKGKTILIQAIGFALGNKPLFPSGFNYKDYYFIVDFEHDNNMYTICRKNNYYFVKNNAGYLMLQTESELKKWFNECVFSLPKIIKKQRIMITDFELLLQVFYLGQDKRDTSSVNSQFFKKEDFISMLCYMNGCSSIELTDEYLELKKELESLKSQKKDPINKTKLIKKLTNEAEIVSEYADKEAFLKRMGEIQEYVRIQSELKRKRNRLFARISKNLNMISEINSIKKTIPEGKLICAACGSTDILYQVDKDITFDISSDDMKKEIVNNLFSLNETLNVQISEVDNELETIVKKLNEVIDDPVVDPVNLVLYNDELKKDLNYEKELIDVKKKIEEKQTAYDSYTEKFESEEEKMDELTNSIVNKVTDYYRYFDKDEDVVILDIFTKSSEIYSGSENTIFFISRLLAFQSILDHKFPVIVDGFREGEISTPTEKKILDEFKKLTKQSILTATLKDEEYHKYDNDNLLSCYDFSSIESKHLLQKDNVEPLRNKISLFNIKI